MPAVNKIVHIRLINGDEVIAELVSENRSKIEIVQPLTVSEQLDENGNATIVLSKYLMDNKNESISILRSHVLTKSDVIQELEEYYRNSLEFNTHFLEKTALENIRKTNEQMQSHLYNYHRMKEIKEQLGSETKVVKIFHQCNTVH